MSVAAVKSYLAEYGLADRIIEFDASSATVELAAEDLGCEPALIAKTMACEVDGHAVLVVCAGDAKLWSSAFKKQFGTKPRLVQKDMLDEVVGHPMGGVCPFAVKPDVEVYLDVSLKRFEHVYPAAGSANSAVKLTVPELEACSKSLGWVDVCKDWREEAAA